ncbi:hypothetical protein [Vannielia litorea]|uniref:Uncharacterized protein n=1 Tax=Vannielia litorea TaxID=1217970 RepID=A0A1N6EIH7_9RHOB|nr:hypothetical protein [Vannielia litorea]SIN82835.1 hypothetical protein SAMN05444002_0824 [Vannielia litorea]
MSAPVPAPEFRHLTLWPARGARFGDGSLAAPKPADPVKDMAETAVDVSPATQG